MTVQKGLQTILFTVSWHRWKESVIKLAHEVAFEKPFSLQTRHFFKRPLSAAAKLTERSTGTDRKVQKDSVCHGAKRLNKENKNTAHTHTRTNVWMKHHSYLSCRADGGKGLEWVSEWESAERPRWSQFGGSLIEWTNPAVTDFYSSSDLHRTEAQSERSSPIWLMTEERWGRASGEMV